MKLINEHKLRENWSGGKPSFALRVSTQPCPGCGETGKRRPSTKVCWECAVDLCEIKKMRAAVEEESKGEVEVLKLPWAYYTLPHVMYDQRVDGGPPDVQQAFYSLFKHLGKPAGDANVQADWLIKPKDYSEGDGPRIYTHGTQQRARDLYGAIMRLSDSAYKEGFRRGNDLLEKLARGQISTYAHEADVTRELKDGE